MKQATDLSLIIVNWNTRDRLRQCLDSILETCSTLSREIIVVDSGSSDGSPELVAREYPAVVLVQLRENRGYAAACNEGIKTSSGRYVLLLNSDVILLPGSVTGMVSSLETRPAVGVVGPRLLNAEGTLQYSCCTFPSLWTSFCAETGLDVRWPRNRLTGRLALTYWDHASTRPVDYVCGGCFMIRREALQAVGLLDEAFFLYSEEVDLCYRLRQVGWVVSYLPQAQAIHLGGESTKQVGPAMKVEQYRSRYRFRRKHYGRARALAFLVLTLVLILLRTLFSYVKLVFESREKRLERREAMGVWREVLRLYSRYLREILLPHRGSPETWERSGVT